MPKSNTLKVRNGSDYRPGHWILMFGMRPRQIAKIRGNVLTLDPNLLQRMWFRLKRTIRRWL